LSDARNLHVSWQAACIDMSFSSRVEFQHLEQLLTRWRARESVAD
jgi:hypothetical protein